MNKQTEYRRALRKTRSRQTIAERHRHQVAKKCQNFGLPGHRSELRQVTGGARHPKPAATGSSLMERLQKWFAVIS